MAQMYFRFHGSIHIQKSFDPRHEKTNLLHMRKQRRRSASR